MKKLTYEEIEKQDPFFHYREDEIRPEIADLLKQARIKRDLVFIPDYRIDKIIELQNEDLDKCIAFMKYAYVGGASWLDVYGKAAEQARAEKKKQKQLDEMQSKIDLIFEMLQDQKQKPGKVIALDLPQHRRKIAE